MSYVKMRRSEFAFIALSLVLAGIIIGALAAPPKVLRSADSAVPGGEKQIEMIIPAVDSQGDGVAGILITTVRPGTGKVLVSINNVLAQFDTQLSGRIAAQAAGDFADVDMETVDIIYEIKVNATAIEGPSAGAAMASSIALALKDIEPDSGIAMTGTIRPDGTVGSVGAIEEKANAAKEAGAEIFLVPRGQGTEEGSVRSEECDRSGRIARCIISYTSNRVNIGEKLGIRIEEVSTLADIINFYKTESTAQ